MADEQPTTGQATARTPAVKPTEFSSAVLDIDKGRVHDDATARLAELVVAVCNTAAKGTVTLKIHVEPLDPETFDETQILMFTGEVSVAIPRPKRSPSLFYPVGAKGAVSRDDPDRTDPRG